MRLIKIKEFNYATHKLIQSTNYIYEIMEKKTADQVEGGGGYGVGESSGGRKERVMEKPADQVGEEGVMELVDHLAGWRRELWRKQRTKWGEEGDMEFRSWCIMHFKRLFI